MRCPRRFREMGGFVAAFATLTAVAAGGTATIALGSGGALKAAEAQVLGPQSFVANDGAILLCGDGEGNEVVGFFVVSS